MQSEIVKTEIATCSNLLSKMTSLIKVMVKYYHQSNAPQDDVCKESSEKYLSLIQHREGKRVEILVRDLQQAILQSIYSCRKA